MAECGGLAPAGSGQWRLEAIPASGEVARFSRTMPEAETLLGRIYDDIAWTPMFAWLPDLR